MTVIEDPVPTPAFFGRQLLVRQEVWRSLSAMIRAYAQAAALSQKEIMVLEAGPRTMVLEHKGRRLLLDFDDRSGIGSFDQQEPAHLRGSFSILEDGALLFAGGEKQLDEAAIDWVEELTRAPAGEEDD